jgi:hypothetical protein
MSNIDEARALRYLTDELNDSIDVDIIMDHSRYATSLNIFS